MAFTFMVGLSVCLSVHLSTCLLVENVFTIVQFCQGKNLRMLQFGLIQQIFFINQQMFYSCI